jgi:hypothetical protein
MYALQTAAAGMTAATNQLNAAASQLAKPGAADESVFAQAAVSVEEAKVQFAANVAVARVADRMMGALLDIVT